MKDNRKHKPKHFADLIEAPKKKKSPPSFYEKVYDIVRQIPQGKVTTYGAIAETIGMKGSSRLVGQALRSMPPEELLGALSAEQIREYLDRLTTGSPAAPRKLRRKK